MALSNTTKARGLWTFGNEIDQTEGAMTVADNVNIDEPGVITPRRGFKDIGYSPNVASMRMKQLMEYKKTPIRHFDNTLEFLRDNEWFTFDGNYLEVSNDIRMKYVEANSNLYFTSSNGIKKIAARDITDLSVEPNYIMDAGVPSALDARVKTEYDSIGFLPPQSKVAYKILYGYKDINNNLLLGAPSTRVVAVNQSQDVYTYERSTFEFLENEDFRKQKVVVTCSTVGDTKGTAPIPQAGPPAEDPNSYIMINPLNSTTNKYIIWFKRGVNGEAPTVSGYQTIEVNLEGKSVSDNVAPYIYEALNNYPNISGFTFTLNGTQIIFENAQAGVSSLIQIPNLISDIGSGWAITPTIVGTESFYIGKYFIFNTKNQSYCVYYATNETVDNPPQDSIVAGKTYLPIVISSNSNKSYIANRTYQEMYATIGTVDLDLNLSTSNPRLIITSTETGNIPDVEQGTILSSTIGITVISQGNITYGDFANVELSFIIPPNIDDRFFYQIYRTPYIEATDGLTLQDIDPGEESYLIYEAPVSGASGTTITHLDNVPETFRQQGTPLYNNPVSGQGILQTNSQPPLSKDIENYRNYTFYANTSDKHSLELTLKDMDGIISPTMTGEYSTFYISNKNISRSYKFRGIPYSGRIFTGTKANTLITKPDNDSKIIMYSARDLTKFVIWFDDGTGTRPDDTDAIFIRVDLTDLEPSTNVQDKLYDSLIPFGDFKVEKITSPMIGLMITNVENGETSFTHTPSSPDGASSSTDIGNGWFISNIHTGEGEMLWDNSILVSGSPSVATNIEVSAKSLVYVINSDVDSPVIAYYMSGANDLPGKIRLVSKNHDDGEFVISKNQYLGDAFLPSIPDRQGVVFNTIDNFVNIDVLYIHEPFTVGQELFIEITSISDIIRTKVRITEIVSSYRYKTDLRINLSIESGYAYPMSASSDNMSMPHRIYYSKIEQPEAVPIVNYIDVGTRDEPIERIVALRDNLFVLKTDGIYMLSGFTAPFTVRLLDSESIVCPDSAAVVNNQIYMLSVNSIISINESSPSIVSRMFEDEIKKVTNDGFNYRSIGFGVGYDMDRAYLLWLPTMIEDTVATQCFRYNVIERTWTRWTKTATCAVVTERFDKLYIGDGERPTVMVERKELGRKDHSDRDFNIFMNVDAISRGWYSLSDVSQLEIGDVAYQAQYITINDFNHLLYKLDNDTGYSSTDYHTLEAEEGDLLSTKLLQLNQKLLNDDTAGNITLHLFNNSDWVSMQAAYNELINELNDGLSASVFKNYKILTGYKEQEYVIIEIDTTRGRVRLNDVTALLSGDITIFKHIKCEVIYNPIHFGNPSAWKQVNQGSIMFDQNNFYKFGIYYATDLSPAFVGREFLGTGPGFWGYGSWDEKTIPYWGGEGNDAPYRTTIPRDKQRCRYITVKFTHQVARDKFKVVGISHNVREFSAKAYRGIKR